MVWMAALSAGASLLGGLSARNAAKKTQKLAIQVQRLTDDENQRLQRKSEIYNRKLGKTLGKALLKEKAVTRTMNKSWVDVKGMMSAAEQAGFNPATWLAAGGMQAYTNSRQTVTQRGHNAVPAYEIMANLMRDTPYVKGTPQVNHVPGVGEAVAGAVGKGLQVYQDDVNRQQSQDFQREMMYAQLDAAADRAMMSRFSGVPGFSTSGPYITSKGSGGLSASEGTNPYPTHSGLGIDKRFQDAEKGADRYGDIAEELFGFTNLAADTIYNIEQSARATQAQHRENPSTDPWFRALGMTGPQRREYVGGLVKQFSAPSSKGWGWYGF